MRARNQWPHLGVTSRRIADDHAAHGWLKQLHEAVEDIALHKNTAARTAVLAGVVEHTVRCGCRSALQIAIVEDDVGALPPSSRVTCFT